MSTAKPPWKKASPKTKSGKASRKLTPAQISAAKQRAKKAGRPYPNLVDNMREAAEAKKKPRARKSTSKQS
jgi:hypothetical protein